MLFTAFTTAPYLPVTRVTALWISHKSDSGVFSPREWLCVSVRAYVLYVCVSVTE